MSVYVADGALEVSMTPMSRARVVFRDDAGSERVADDGRSGFRICVYGA